MMQQTPTAETISYPDSDGNPLSDNTRQFRWIMTLKGNLDILYRDVPEVFVAGDLLWYPVKGSNTVRAAPDVMVAFGRPKGDRGSYKQWEEENIPPLVVFEVLSPGNRMREMALKFDFYERYGVEEYYIYNPDTFDFSVWQRSEGRLRIVEDDLRDDTWVSPRLGIRFVAPGDGELQVFYPDGRPFLGFVDLEEARLAAERRAMSAEQRATSAEQRAEQLASKLRALGIDPQTV
ncbi:MAG: Uma2 family endonuclease [Cytophagales bacterium]|nr:Uma2 family endonuclease [Armatimonadota bacterium]